MTADGVVQASAALWRRWLWVAVVVIGELVLYFVVCRPEMAFFHSDPEGYRRLRGAGPLSAEARCAIVLVALPATVWLVGKVTGFLRPRTPRG